MKENSGFLSGKLAANWLASVKTKMSARQREFIGSIHGVENIAHETDCAIEYYE
jgi:hypothetical protein